jgi:hypothetical protein
MKQTVLTEEIKSTAARMNTGSSAASNRSYFASSATPGKRINGVMIIRLMTATKTARFSPG